MTDLFPESVHKIEYHLTAFLEDAHPPRWNSVLDGDVPTSDQAVEMKSSTNTSREISGKMKLLKKVVLYALADGDRLNYRTVSPVP